MKRIALLTFSAICSVISLLFAIIWFSRVNMNYNSEGVYFDEASMITYDKDGVITYGFISIIFLIISIVGFVVTFKIKNGTNE